MAELTTVAVTDLKSVADKNNIKLVDVIFDKDNEIDDNLIIVNCNSKPKTRKRKRIDEDNNDDEDDNDDDDDDSSDDSDVSYHKEKNDVFDQMSQQQQTSNHDNLCGYKGFNHPVQEEDDRIKRFTFHSDRDTLQRIINNKCGFTRKLCDEIDAVRWQHNGSTKLIGSDPVQCKSCYDVVQVIRSGVVPQYYKNCPNGDDSARGYVIYGSQLLTSSEVRCSINTDYTLTTGLKASMKLWNSLVIVSSRDSLRCAFQVMTNEHTLDRTDHYGVNSNPPPPRNQRFMYSITLQWRCLMHLRLVRFIADTYYPDSKIVPLWK